MTKFLTHNSSENIEYLFEQFESIRIPAYQRSYSWEDAQCVQFLDDLNEQIGKSYYLGQFLFETVGKTLYIIDGQQRITTTIIFLSAIAKIKTKRCEDVLNITNKYLNNVFRTIEEDQDVFKRLTQKYVVPNIEESETFSQKRIISAFNYFTSQLEKMDSMSLNLIVQTLEKAVISIFIINSKIEAIQVFEYQNSRGKKLSNFENLKAYLMNQVYIHSQDSSKADEHIISIQKNVSKIYRNIEIVEGFFTENELLSFATDLHYNTGGNLDSVKGKLKNIQEKTEWIVTFFENFLFITESAKNIKLNKKSISEVTNLLLLGNSINWKYVVLAISYKGESNETAYFNILKMLEILSFKFKLSNYRADYLSYYSKLYYKAENNYDINNLYLDIKKVTEIGFKDYWNYNDVFRDLIKGYFQDNKLHYHNRFVVKYVLWQYENFQRKNRMTGLLLDIDLFNDYTIEHISPQNPPNAHSEEFKANYLHVAGNLALLTNQQNSKFGNKPFEIKRDLFQDTALVSYTEIRENSNWSENEILARHNQITKFALQYFDLTNL